MKFFTLISLACVSIAGCVSTQIADRTTTWHMENWLGPFRRWYNEDVSSVDYAMIAVNSNAVLEVGLETMNTMQGICLCRFT